MNWIFISRDIPVSDQRSVLVNTDDDGGRGYDITKWPPPEKKLTYDAHDQQPISAFETFTSRLIVLHEQKLNLPYRQYIFVLK